MAKRNKKKRATALFEVMSAGKSLELPVVRSRPLVQPPGWWTKWRQYRAQVAEAKAARAAELAAMPAPVEVAPPPPRIEIKPEPIVAAEIASPDEPGRKRFSFKIDFTTGVIIISGLVCFVGLTFLISQKIANPRPPVMAATQARPQTPRQGTLEVPRNEQVQPRPEERQPVIEPHAPSSEKRVVNMNYVIIQSFPNEKDAQEAAEFLNKHGVGCSVIQSLARWTNKTQWFTIVGTKPFPPRSSGTQEYVSYVGRIKEVGAKYAGKSKWNRFDPQPYRWDMDSEK